MVYQKLVSPPVITILTAITFAVIGAGAIALKKDQKKEREPFMLKLAFPIHSSVGGSGLDPARVDTTTQANLIWNIYGRLVEYDKNGQIVSGMAEIFEWRGDEIYFKLRSGIYTSSGYPITAEDAAFSLKRLMLKNSNTHGDLRSFLCPEYQIKTIHDDCPGVRVEGNSLVLRPIRPYLGKFLIPLLASVDFSVIPKIAVHLNGSSLDIFDYKNTSGAYFIEEDDKNGSLLLKANPAFHSYSDKMPKSIQVVPVSADQSIEKLKKGEVDLITTTDPALAWKVLDIENEVENLSVHRSMSIKTWVLQFTRKGQRVSTRDQRIFVGKEFRHAYKKSLLEERITPTIEFFPTFGEGSLDEKQQSLLKKAFTDSSDISFSQKMVLGVPASRVEKYESVLKGVNTIQVKGFTSAPWMLPEMDQPDMYIANIDGAFFEDISMISYNADHGTFGMTRQEGVEWLNEYMKIEDKAERLKRLRALHFKFLSEATVIPLGNAPYVAVARAPWKIHFSQFFAGSPLWQVRKE